MTYDYTDKELNVLNQEGYVYSVNPDVALKSKYGKMNVEFIFCLK